MALCECHALPMVCSLAALQADCLADATRNIERAEARIAALEAQVAALAGALRQECPDCADEHLDSIDGRSYSGRMCSQHFALFTAHDARRLAALDAARRAVCEAARAVVRVAYVECTELGALDAALDELARLER